MCSYHGSNASKNRDSRDFKIRWLLTTDYGWTRALHWVEYSTEGAKIGSQVGRLRTTNYGKAAVFAFAYFLQHKCLSKESEKHVYIVWRMK